MQHFKRIIGASVLLAGLACAGHAEGKAPAFTLEDQFKKVYDVRFPAAKPLILIFARKDDTVWAQSKKWQLAFKTGLQDKADVRTVVVLGGYVSPIRAIVKAHMKEQPPLLLDWGGKAGEAYQFDEKAPLPKVVVIDAAGSVLSAASERYTQDAYDRLAKLILKDGDKVSANGKSED